MRARAQVLLRADIRARVCVTSVCVCVVYACTDLSVHVPVDLPDLLSLGVPQGVGYGLEQVARAHVRDVLLIRVLPTGSDQLLVVDAVGRALVKIHIIAQVQNHLQLVLVNPPPQHLPLVVPILLHDPITAQEGDVDVFYGGREGPDHPNVLGGDGWGDDVEGTTGGQVFEVEYCGASSLDVLDLLMLLGPGVLVPESEDDLELVHVSVYLEQDIGCG